MCGRTSSPDRTRPACDCGRPELVHYDLAPLRGRFTPEALRRHATASMWRFEDVLPVLAHEAVSLGEGMTSLLPLHPDPRGLRRVWVKDESSNPTASFKARGLSAAISMALRNRVPAVALPSAGNAGMAAALYAARAGIPCHVFVPRDTPRANVIETRLAGAEVTLVDGLIDDCGKLVRDACERNGWLNLATLKEPYRLEGKKTMGYELALDLGAARAIARGRAPGSAEARLPDVILYPTGGGTGLIGMWKAFDEMETLGWIGSARPRMVAVQAEGCAPIVRAFEADAEGATRFENARTVASGLRVPGAVGDRLMLDALRASRGTAITVSDRELLRGAEVLHREHGIAAAPEGGAVWAAAGALLERGWLDPDDEVVLFNTGSSLPYLHLWDDGGPIG